MRSRKTKLVFVLVASAILILVIVKMITPKWVSLYDIDYCANLKNENITEITMMQTADSAHKVVFSDEDLIEEWISFLDSVVIKFSWKHTYFPKRIVGGHPRLIVQTNESRYHLTFHEESDGRMIIIDKKHYLINEPVDVPFVQIYKTAVDRHGTVSVFGD